VDGNKVLDDDGSPAASSGAKRPDTAAFDWKKRGRASDPAGVVAHRRGRSIHLNWEAPAQVQLDEALAEAGPAD